MALLSDKMGSDERRPVYDRAGTKNHVWVPLVEHGCIHNISTSEFFFFHFTSEEN